MLDCYRVIVYPFKKKLTFGQTLLIIASSWIVCYLIVALLLSFSFELLKGFWVDVQCVEKPRSNLRESEEWFSLFFYFAYHAGSVSVVFFESKRHCKRTERMCLRYQVINIIYEELKTIRKGL